MIHIHSARDEQLQSAIECGDLKLVAQYLSSGIGVNTVLLSSKSRESATVLGTSAFENQEKIVQYLVDCLHTPVNFQDTLSMRTALHWACIGNSYPCARFLIESGAYVNCCDRDNVTPIIQASMIGSTDIVHLLINHGAQVNAMDRLHSTALHYAAFHGRQKLTQMLIRAGCIANNTTIFGQGTPLSNLTFRYDFESIRLLLEAGYNMNVDSWILRYEKHGGLGVTSPDIASYLKFKYSNPPTLCHLCRCKVRKSFNGVLVERSIESLALPQLIKDYLLLQFKREF